MGHRFCWSTITVNIDLHVLRIILVYYLLLLFYTRKFIKGLYQLKILLLGQNYDDTRKVVVGGFALFGRLAPTNLGHALESDVKTLDNFILAELVRGLVPNQQFLVINSLNNDSGNDSLDFLIFPIDKAEFITDLGVSVYFSNATDPIDKRVDRGLFDVMN